MTWLFRSLAHSGDSAARDVGTSARFRVESLEPRLLLSGDPLDLVKESLEPALLPEPVAAVESSTSSPSIDWAGSLASDANDIVTPEPSPLAGSEPQSVVHGSAVAAAQASTSTVSPTSVGSMPPPTAGWNDDVTSHIEDTYDARGPPYMRVPLAFQPNMGQASAGTAFLSQGAEANARPVTGIDPLASVPVPSLETPLAPSITVLPPVDPAGAEVSADARSTLVADLSPLKLVDDDRAALVGQVIYLDYDGASAVAYDGPMRVEGITVAPFRAPAPLTGEESSIIGSVLTGLNQGFADLAVTFTDLRPAPRTDYSTIFLGGNDSAFSQYGSFLGLAEKVDVGNQDRNDEAFVFSDKLYATGMTLEDYESALTAVIGHEARHLLGFEHATGETAGLGAVAAGAPDLPGGATIKVNSAGDRNARDEFLTLREAILLSNRTLAVSTLTEDEKALVNGAPSDATRDRIEFNIPSGGIQTILVGAGGLPLIADPVIIDGTTQPGFSSGTQMPIMKIGRAHV